MLRLVEIILPQEEAQRFPDVLEQADVADPLGVWNEDLTGEQGLVRVLVDQAEVEALMDFVNSRYGAEDEPRMIVLAVETSLPREEDEEEPDEAPPAEEEEEGGEPFFPRISREEIYDTIAEMATLDGRYLSFILLATLVAAIGLLQDNVAIIIGSMVIAPLLGPVVALGLATVLVDLPLARTAVRSNLAGVAIVLGASAGLGLVVPVDPAGAQMAIRTSVSLWDVGLGLAVGVAGALSFTTGLATALVGVMVAVALLPPLVAAGLLAGAGHGILASLAGLQALVYLISINLSAVTAFALQGIRPANWWEESKSRRATRWAVVLWAGLLALLAALVWYAGAA